MRPRTHTGGTPAATAFGLEISWFVVTWDVTNGSIGLVVCTLHTPDDKAAEKVATLALLQKQVPGDVTKDLFFQPLGCCSTF